jgi:hypothetical protein
MMRATKAVNRPSDSAQGDRCKLTTSANLLMRLKHQGHQGPKDTKGAKSDHEAL